MLKLCSVGLEHALVWWNPFFSKYFKVTNFRGGEGGGPSPKLVVVLTFGFCRGPLGIIP